MAESLILAAATTATTAAGTTAVALPWLSTAGSLASIASAGGVAGGIASVGTAMGGISSLLSVGSAIGQVSSGMQQSAIYKAQAQQYQLAAKQEELRGREQADRIRRSLQATLASQNAIFSARGIATGTGTPVTLARKSMTEAGADIEAAMFSAGQSAGALRSQAAQSKISASSAMTSGFTGAAEKLYKNRDAFGSLLR